MLDYRGKEGESELKITFNPAWEEVTLVSASVTNPDGSRKVIAKEEVNVMDAPWSGSAPRYPGGKILVASLPGVEVGSVIETEIVRVAKDRPFVSACEFFRESNPVVKRTVIYAYPKELPVKIARMNWTGVAEKTGEADGRITVEWTVGKQPALVDESSLPPRWTFLPAALVSVGDWKAYGAEVNSAWEKAASGQSETERKAMSFGAKAGSREFVRAVRDFVAKNIRNAGPVFHELPLAAITPADKTIADGYGNAADRAVVLYAMLKAGGCSPKFVLASGEPNLEQIVAPVVETPQRFFFGNALVEVECGGEKIYLNDTDQYAELGTTSCEGRMGCHPASGMCEKIAPPTGKENRTEVVFDVSVSADGRAVLKRTRKLYGMFFANERRQYAEMTPEERRRHFQNLVAGISQSAKAVGGLSTSFDVYPGVEELTVEIPNYAVADERRLYFALPFAFTNFFSPDSESREYPMLWASRSDSRYEITVTLPKEFSKMAIAPSDVDLDIPGRLGKLSVRSGWEGDAMTGRWKVTGSLLLNEGMISPERYKDLLKLDDLVALKNAVMFLLEKP